MSLSQLRPLSDSAVTVTSRIRVLCGHRENTNSFLCGHNKYLNFHSVVTMAAYLFINE